MIVLHAPYVLFLCHSVCDGVVNTKKEINTF